MKTTIDYLDELRIKLQLPSDYAVAKALGCTRASVSRYRNGVGSFDDATAIKVADLLGLEPLEIIAAANFERAKDEHSQNVWASIWGKVAGAIVPSLIACAVGLSVAPTSKAAESGNTNTASSGSLYIMSNRRRDRKASVSGLLLAA
jgi:predicted transcriptional regulator